MIVNLSKFKFKSLFFIFIFLLFSIILFLIITSDSISPDLLLPLFLTVMIFLIALIAVSFVIQRSDFDIFELVYWSLAYFLLLFGIRSIHIFLYGSPFIGKFPFDSRTLSAFNFALFYILLSLIIFLIGYYSNLGLRLSNSVSSLYLLPKIWNVNKARVLIVILSITGLLFHLYFIRTLGGYKYYIFNKSETMLATGDEYIKWGASLTNYAFFIAYIIWLKTRKLRFFYLILLPINFLLAFLSGSKGSFLSIILVMLVIYSYLKKKIKILHIIYFVLFALIIIFPIFNAYRGNFEDFSELILYGQKRIGHALESEESFIYEIFHRFAGTDMLTIAVRDTPDVEPFQFGKTVYLILVAPIPRKLWADKPIISVGRWFGMKYLNGFQGAAAVTIIGDGYINFHIAGIIFFSLVMGMFARFMYHYCIIRGVNYSSVYVYAIFFNILFKSWELSIVTLIIRLILAAITTFVICFFLKDN